MVIAIDFDDTLFHHIPPPEGVPDYSGRPGSIGDPIHPILFKAKRMREDGHRLILWTCREGKALEEAVEICRLHGLEFDAVNDNLPDLCTPGVWPNSRKVKADAYWGDRAVHVGVVR